MIAALLRQWAWPQWRHHPWRHAAALLAVLLGVALAFAVHLINESALAEFGAAVRSVNGQPDFELSAQRGGFDEGLYARVAAHPRVVLASPVVELETSIDGKAGERVPLRLLGIDALTVGGLAPALAPRPADGQPRLAVVDPDALFLNPAARARWGDADRLTLQAGAGMVTLPVRGSVSAEGAPLAVMDIAGAQAHFGWLGRLSRIDVRLAPGADRAAVLADLALPPGVHAGTPAESAQRVSNISRAYRVNLTVLALVALFTGAFLVYSVLSLSVTQRQPQFALLGVLGLAPRERLALVLAESALIGVVGSLAGLALGTGLAALALRLLAGDLGGGYFPGVRPTLHFSVAAAIVYGLLGVAAAVAGGWFPARSAERMAPAQALKGLGGRDGTPHRPWLGPALLVAGGLLALAPPIAGIPLAAYVAVACMLLGGIAIIPAGVGLLLRFVPPPAQPVALLAIERARHQRHTATVAVASVVASLALAVALTVMVSSFRDAVTQWLDTLLPAELYVRTGAGGPAGEAWLGADMVARVAQLPGVERVETQRVAPLQLDPARPSVALIVRPLHDPAQALPLVGALRPRAADAVPVYVSEAMVSLYGMAPGKRLTLPLPDGRQAEVEVRGVWRDYARQHGAVAMARDDFLRLTGDARVGDLALWLRPDADMAQVQAAIRALADDPRLIEFATPGEIRATSLRIFDRSFAVTYWLQAVAIGIGLFGIAASFSAQVFARRKEFGLLAHLGYTARQVLALVAAEGAVWSATGALLGLALGLAVSVVLVKVVNPQSFHWTMDLNPPWLRLALLCGAVLLAGSLTAWFSARAAASREAALAVKEDW